jgi:hypothetical protein
MHGGGSNLIGHQNRSQERQRQRDRQRVRETDRERDRDPIFVVDIRSTREEKVDDISVLTRDGEMKRCPSFSLEKVSKERGSSG